MQFELGSTAALQGVDFDFNPNWSSNVQHLEKNAASSVSGTADLVSETHEHRSMMDSPTLSPDAAALDLSAAPSATTVQAPPPKEAEAPQPGTESPPKVANEEATPAATTPAPSKMSPQAAPFVSPSTETIAVTDPLSRKLMLPLVALRPTLATSRPGVPSLCLLYLEGRCRQGSQCHQVHADPQVALQLRAEAKQQPTCCGAHGDVNESKIPQAWASLHLDIGGILVPMRLMAFTVALERTVSEHLAAEPSAAVIRAQIHQICRLHGSERCRFTEDCRFLHLCRNLLRERFAAVVPDLIPQLELRHHQRSAGGAARAGGPSQQMQFAPQYPTQLQGAPMQQQQHQPHIMMAAPSAQPQFQQQQQQPQFVLLPDGRLAQVVQQQPQQNQQQQQQVQMMALPPGFQIVGSMPQQQQQQPAMGSGVPIMLQSQQYPVQWQQ